MFGKLISDLLKPAPSALPTDSARLALGALLVRVARADGTASQQELDRIDRALAARYGLSGFEAVAVRQKAEVLESEAPDTVRFTRALKEAVPYEDRQSLIETLWSVALADGVRDAQEDAHLRLVANLLGISDRDSAFARQRSAKG